MVQGYCCKSYSDLPLAAPIIGRLARANLQLPPQLINKINQAGKFLLKTYFQTESIMAYKDIVPVGTGLIISATSFGLGVIYSNLPYDFGTLWNYDPTGKAFEKSLAHYTTWAEAPMFVHHILHFVFFLGLVGCFIKLYKPIEDAKYFEYGTLGLVMISIIIYLTNLRVGINSCSSGDWGEVDMPTGINVMAASQVMMIVALIGVLVLQGGLYYASWYDEKLKKEFFEQEAAEAAKAAEKDTKPEEPVSASKSSGSSSGNTKPKKRSK